MSPTRLSRSRPRRSPYRATFGGKKHRVAAFVVVVLAVVLGAVGIVAPEPAAAMPGQALPAVSGAGSTWSQNALDQWRADVSRQGLRVNYQGVGSSAGRNLFAQGSVDFAVSEVPYQAGEGGPPYPFVYLPIVAGGTAAIYRVRDSRGQQITNLRLSPALTARIFTRDITRWNHDAIAAENRGVALPDTEITVVVRSDGSGTSFQFSAYLANRAPGVWADFARANNIRNGPTSNWPTLTGSTGQVGSDGVTNYVAQSNGAITYAETSYAIERRLPVASIRNQAGNYVLPTATNVSVALTAARFNADRTQILDGVYVHPHGSAYPISSYSYMLVRTNGMNPDKGRVIARFVYYFACQGQQRAAPLGYSPMPTNLVQAAFSAIVQVPGAERPPVISAATCPNPAVTGEHVVPGGADPNAPGGGAGNGGTGGPGANTGTTDGTNDNAGTGPTGDGTTGDTTGQTGDAVDLDGDGIPDGEDLDGDGIADTYNGEELADVRNTADNAIDAESSGAIPALITALLLLLLVAPPVLLAVRPTRPARWRRRPAPPSGS